MSRPARERLSRRATWPAPLAAAAAALTACGGQRVPPTLVPEPIAYVDTLPIPEPTERELAASAPAYAAIVGSGSSAVNVRRWTGAIRDAVNVTRFDDVVSSAWFERRNGYRTMTPEEVGRGPTTSGPSPDGDLRVVAPSEGRTPGFIVEDPRGDRYLLKFDPPGYPHLATAADVITSRLLYAAGYHTPENYIVSLDGARLVPEPGSGVTAEEVGEVLANAPRLPDGRLLAMASKFLPGIPKGPFRFEGRRADDPNDYYHHEHRRELRGLFVIAAWLNHVELRFTNTLDTYVEGGYLRHHLLDFGESLGSGTLGPLDPRAGRESNFDLSPVLTRFVTLGFGRPPWSMKDSTVVHPSIGRLSTDDYHPGDWRPRWSNDAFANLTARDGYWGAKIVSAFTDEQIRAAVGAGGFSDPAAERLLADILIDRRDRTVAHWYARVTPIENPRVGAPGENPDPANLALEISFDDLAIRDGVRGGAVTTYRYRFRHEALGVDVTGETAADRGTPRQTLRIAAAVTRGRVSEASSAPAADRIATLEIQALDEGVGERSATVALVLDPAAGRYAVVGLEH